MTPLDSTRLDRLPQIDTQGQRGRYALFALEPSPDQTSFALKSVGAEMYLGLTNSGAQATAGTPVAMGSPYYWQYSLAAEAAAAGGGKKEVRAGMRMSGDQ